MCQKQAITLTGLTWSVTHAHGVWQDQLHLATEKQQHFELQHFESPQSEWRPRLQTL